MINIFNIRGGFANNSSSSHSIIFKSIPMDLTDNYCGDLQFGWDTFTIGTKEGVLDYLKAILAGNFHYEMNDDYIRCIIESWVGPIPTSDIPSIDHQSMVSLPYNYKEDAINKEFFMDLKQLFLSQDTVILGGNDNDGEHPLTGLAGTSPNLLTERSGYIAKKDPVYDYWTFFNRGSGDKFRCVLNQNGMDNIKPIRASSPDLVDIKITDYCNFNCSFCYQGSTADGKHAPFDHLSQIVDTLSRKEVLEIAYGGGEPTQHPDFIRLLEYTRKRHIIPNFTTKNLSWLKENINSIAHTIGSCAYSVRTTNEIHQLAVIRDFYNLTNSKITAQIVMGTISERELSAIVSKCAEERVPLTLLGFKETGRGSSFRGRVNYDNWLDVVTKALANYPWYRIGVDTALVRQSQDALNTHGIPKWSYHSDEGMFSWYIDAAGKRMGSSSYEETVPYDNIHYDFNTLYNQYGDRVEAEMVASKKPKRARPKKQ